MKRLLLLDGNNYGFAGMNNPKLSAGEHDTQAILSVLKRIRNIVADHPDSMIMVLWDGKSWRKDIYKEYKANREQTEKQVEVRSAYYEQKKGIVEGLKLLGVTQTSAANMEADDLAQILTKNAVSKNIPVTLLTADHDWMQLIEKNVVWMDLVHNKRCDFNSFKEITGFKDINQFVEAKCILGDRGDNIFGIKGLGEKTLENIYNIYDGGFEEFLNDKPEVVETFWLKYYGKKLPKILRELDRAVARAKVVENLALVDLATDKRPKPEGLRKERLPLNEVGFYSFCARNSFLSIIRDMEKFLRPFKENINVIRQVSQTT